MHLERYLGSFLGSLMRPWLIDQIEGDFKLGFRKCEGIWNNLEFDHSKIDYLVESSTRLAVAQVRVAKLRVVFNPWSWPNLSVTVNGLDVVLLPRDLSKENSRQLKFTNAESKLDLTADSIDPEGAFLREILENSLKTSQGSRMKTYSIEAFLSRCQLLFLDTSFRVSFAGESNFLALTSKEISLQPRLLYECSLLLLWRTKGLSLLCNCKSLELDINERDSAKKILSLKDPAASIKFRKLNPVLFDLRFPSVDSFISSSDIPVLFLLLNLLSGKVNSKRSGKELWKIVGMRMSQMSSRPRYLWANILQMVMLWLKYVHVYESLLSLIGYYDENAMKFLSSSCYDPEFPRRIQCLLEVVDEVEKKLPIAAVVRARVIARKRVCQQPETRPFPESPFSAFRGKFFFMPYLAWKFILIFFNSLRTIIRSFMSVTKLYEGLHNVDLTWTRESRVNVVVENFSFETSIDKRSRERTNHFQSLPSISLILKSFSLINITCGNKKDVFAALGSVFVLFSSPVNAPLMEEELDVKTAAGRHRSRVILWSEPENSFHSETALIEHAPKVDIHTTIVESSLDEIHSLWKQKCEEAESKMENPFFLFRLEKKFLGLSSHRVTSGIIRCISTMGNVIVDLDCEIIAFVICLDEQINDSLRWIDQLCVPLANSNQLAAAGKSDVAPSGELQLFPSKLQLSLLELMPLVNIQICIKVVGCNIKLSFPGVGEVDAYSARPLISTDLSGIELCAWPASLEKLLEINPGLALPAVYGEFFWLKEPYLLEIPENDVDESFAVQGRVSHNASINLTAASSFENLEGNGKSQVIGLILLNVIASASRQYLHSFYSSEDAFSLSFDGKVRKSDLVICIDELQALFEKVSEEITSTRSRFSIDCEAADMYSLREYVKNLLSTKNDDVKVQRVVSSNDKVLDHPNFQLMFDSSIDLRSLNLILSRTMKTKYSAKRKSGVERSNDSSVVQNFINLPNANWGIFIERFLIQASLGQRNVKFLINISDIRSNLYAQEHELKLSENALMHSCLHGRPGFLSGLHLPYIILNLSGTCSQHSLLSDSIIALGSVFQFLSELEIGKVIVANRSHKIPFLDNQCGGLHVQISGTEGLQEIKFESKGGYFLLDTKDLALFIQTAREYSVFLKSLQWFNPRRKRERQYSNMVFSGKEENRAKHPLWSSESLRWCHFDTVDLNVSQFSLIFANHDDFGAVRYLAIEVGLHFGFSKIEGKFFSEILYLTLFSLRSPEKNGDFDTTIYSSIPIDSQTLASIAQASSSDQAGTSKSVRDIYLNSSPEFPSKFQPSYLLKKLYASIVIEKNASDGYFPSSYFRSNWLGSGTVFGFILNISISEIQMIKEMFYPFSSISTMKSKEISQQTVQFQSGRSAGSNFEILDGAVVAIKDIHQHQYLAIESARETHRLVSTLHYSLVGERALFRVNWHKGKPTLLVLNSFHAKDKDGETVCLNFASGSGIVEVSKRCGRSSLWKLVPYKVENYLDASDAEYSTSACSPRKAFYLVNYKSNSGVAFVDGVPEFVRKPGNPYKLKLFHELTQKQDVVQRNLPMSNNHGQYPVTPIQLHINIKMERISATIFQEISGGQEKFPLIRGCIDDMNLIVQILEFKFRLMCSYFLLLDYFDGQRNNWGQVIAPVNSRMFLHSRNQSKNSEYSLGTLSHFHFGINQVLISLTELSLDILLFICGRLDISGPYTMRNSIFQNCCKVENLSNLNLICRFGKDHDVMVAGRKTVSVLPRHGQTTGELQEITRHVSVRACKSGGFFTLPLNISLQESITFAWRTHVPYQEDFFSPAPCLAVKISTKTEDGLFLSVSPLIRFHNTTGLLLELRISPGEGGPSTIIPLGTGDSMDDLKLIDESGYSEENKQALLSLSEGNFVLSFKPDISCITNNSKEIFVEWSEDMPCGKAVSLSDSLLDKLYQKFGEASGSPFEKSSLTTICCPLLSSGRYLSYLHFLIHISARDLRILESPGEGVSDAHNSMYLPQKEIFISPTVQVFNLLQTEILVVLAETYPDASVLDNDAGKCSTISFGSSAYFYANPRSLYLMLSLCPLGLKCKPVDTSKCVKKLQKKIFAHYFDIELDFDGGKQSAYLRLCCGERGILEVTVFSSFTLQNNTEISLCCFTSSHKGLTPERKRSYASSFPFEHGVLLTPNNTSSWLSKSRRLYISLNEGTSSELVLDLDALSGFTELKFVLSDEAGVCRLVRVGVSLQALRSKNFTSAQIIIISARYIISNESMNPIFYRFCDSENGADEITLVETKSKATLYAHPFAGTTKAPLFDTLFFKHRHIEEDSSVFIQFGVNNNGYSWSGPVCISSLGRFFLKFKREKLMNSIDGSDNTNTEKRRPSQFAFANIVEESSTLVLYFHMPPDLAVPYRIENKLRGTSITFYQKETGDPEILGAGDLTDYVWDNQNKPRKLIVQISGFQFLREINIDKLSPWRPFFKSRPSKLLTLQLSENKTSRIQIGDNDGSRRLELQRLGYEVYVNGSTRVLRICERLESSQRQETLHPNSSFSLRMESFSINLLGSGIEEEETKSSLVVVTIRLCKPVLQLWSTYTATYLHSKVETINVENKWKGAPFASMIRRSHLYDSSVSEDMLHFVCIFQSENPNLKEVKHMSLLVQPFDLNLDEETLMKLASFWRKSLSESTSHSQLYYFKQFEIHPLKIRTCFLPGNPHSSYNSAQETLRLLLHTIIKVPAIKDIIIELNGVLLNHALLTRRELMVKCAQHYSWYIVRAVYIAKGSPLLPPAFVSIFDDTSSSALDVFFDPSSGSVDLPGFTLGVFKFLNKYANAKGFSGTRRYLGDLRVTIKKAGSSVLFAAITEISDSILRGAETDGFSGLVKGFHQGLMRLAMEPSLLGAAVMHGGPDRKIFLDQSPGADELYIEGYLQSMLHLTYNQEYLQVKVIDNLVHLKNLPPNSTLIDEIIDNVKSFLVSQGLLKGDGSISRRPLRYLGGEREWSVGPMVLTLCEHLFVSFTIRILRAKADEFIDSLQAKTKKGPGSSDSSQLSLVRRQGRVRAVGGFILSGIFAYVDGWLCRRIPNPIVRRIVSGFLLTFLEHKDKG